MTLQPLESSTSPQEDSVAGGGKWRREREKSGGEEAGEESVVC